MKNKKTKFNNIKSSIKKKKKKNSMLKLEENN